MRVNSVYQMLASTPYLHIYHTSQNNVNKLTKSKYTKPCIFLIPIKNMLSDLFNKYWKLWVSQPNANNLILIHNSSCKHDSMTMHTAANFVSFLFRVFKPFFCSHKMWLFPNVAFHNCHSWRIQSENWFSLKQHMNISVEILLKKTYNFLAAGATKKLKDFHGKCFMFFFLNFLQLKVSLYRISKKRN